MLRTENASANRRCAIRAKTAVWRALRRREGLAGENFFIAKIRDSESAQRAFGCYRCTATKRASRYSFVERTTKTSAAQPFPAIPTITDAAFSRIVRIAAAKRRRACVTCASRAPTLTRQHFLKRDAVF